MAMGSLGMVLVFVAFTVVDVEGAGAVFAAVRSWIESTLGWSYILAICVMLVACLYIMCSRHGKVRLGDDDGRPEFSTFSWLAMLFSAGLGIGLLFFSISEPMFYFDNSAAFGYPNNPHADMAGAVDLDEARAADAMRVTYFHWGFHAWSVYVVVGLCLAYFGFRKKLPLTLRSALYPIIGDRIYGPVGHGVDLLAVFGTVFGVATSLGLGVKQMAAGLDTLFGVVPDLAVQITLIVVISAAATLSAVSGVARGIRIISEWNIYLSIVLLAFFLCFGPIEWLLGFFVTTVGDYLLNLVPMGLWVAAEAPDAAWQGGWTVFYWGWWIAWAPFVGMFIARISRGRTIREFTIGTMFVPTVVGIVWLCLFGGNALYMELNAAGGVGTAGILDLVRDWQLEAALYGTIERMTDLSWLVWSMSALATFLLATWFITSSDSGTLVIATMLSMGDDHPPRRFRVVWGAAIGTVAAALLLADGLQALQAASIAAALPVCIVLLAMTAGVITSLNRDSSAVPATGTD
ncbi:MAG: BCCT family transporter [Gammaproteobacteria bacterium]|nr:BCCT family transporter [Gammaproteobacteria bacterium]